MHVVSFSTGLSSALTGERVLRRYGAASIIFMDTLIEDEDNYRFRDEVLSRWLRLYTVDVVTLRDGRDPYEVAGGEHIIPNQKLAPCTFRLKIEPFINWCRSAASASDLTIHIGYDFSEVHRCAATKKSYEAYGWSVDFPLLWRPFEYRDYSQVAREDWGIEPPRMYAMGYSHANCGGRCVKQGQGDWIRTLINFPDRFREAEEWEERMRDHPKRKSYAILRNQSGGVLRPLTLQELRLQYEAKQLPTLPLLDFESGCVHCGVSSL